MLAKNGKIGELSIFGQVVALYLDKYWAYSSSSSAAAAVFHFSIQERRLRIRGRRSRGREKHLCKLVNETLIICVGISWALGPSDDTTCNFLSLSREAWIEKAAFFFLIFLQELQSFCSGEEERTPCCLTTQETNNNPINHLHLFTQQPLLWSFHGSLAGPFRQHLLTFQRPFYLFSGQRTCQAKVDSSVSIIRLLTFVTVKCLLGIYSDTLVCDGAQSSWIAFIPY